MDQAHLLIDRCCDPNSARYGKLLNWQNSGDPCCHYGIGLSDQHIFDTGQGLQIFVHEDSCFVLGVDSIAFKPEASIARLKFALDIFKDWNDILLGWNCEHLARLIAADQPRCYQSKPLWWMAGMDSNGDHKIARQLLSDYLRVNAPELLSEGSKTH
jgi:hypothetical protein